MRSVARRLRPSGPARDRGAVVGWGRSTSRTLRALQLGLVALFTVAGAVSVFSAYERGAATERIESVLQPLSAGATGVYRSLAAADATVTTGFLAGGTEPVASQQQYEASIAAASEGIAGAARQASDVATAQRIAQLSAELPIYTGLVEQARANNRRDLPVGAAYLRRASELMQTSMLPSAEALQARQGQLLDEAHRTAASFPVTALVITLLALAGLVATQVWLAFRFRRTFNRGLLLATFSVLAGLVWWTVAGLGAGVNLQRAHSHSDMLSDGLGPAQVAALQARAAETLSLVQRDGGETEPDFMDRMQRLCRGEGVNDAPVLAIRGQNWPLCGYHAVGGALGAAALLAPDEADRDSVTGAVARADDYLLEHRRVRDADDRGEYAEAVRLAVSQDGRTAASAFRSLAEALAAEDRKQQKGFGEAIRSAQLWRSGLVWGTGMLAVLAVLGVVTGIGERLKEYR